MTKNSLLALPPLLAVVSFKLTLLAATFCSARVGDLEAVRGQRTETLDRQFLAELEQQGRQDAQVATLDRTFLDHLHSADLATIPRAAFVAPPRPAPLAASDTASAVIPRATLVAPPRSVSPTAFNRASSGMQLAQTTTVPRAQAVSGAPKPTSRRASIIIYDGKVFTTRATVMN
jgi:hypothetical protein